MKKQFLVLARTALAAGVASAHHTKGGSPSPAPSPAPSTAISAPEFDSGSMIAGLTLLTGVAMVLLGRRRIS
jgi:hypothetical protein